MKAVQINKYGGIDVLELNNNSPKLSPTKNQILVKVYATSINPFDWKVREGYLKEMKPLEFPITLGGDFAGVVSELGENAAQFNIGDEVYGTANIFSGGSGAFAEFTCAKETNMALKPKTINFYEAAALPIVGSSVVQALEEHIKLKAGQKILIHGGGGGIGHIAIQLAKIMGAYVATTANKEDEEFIKSLGADEFIDYKNEKFENKIKNFDVVYDTVGGETIDRSFLVLKKNGILISMPGQPNQNLAKKYELTAIGQDTKVNTQHLNRVREKVESKKIKVHIDKIFPLEEVRKAFAQLETVHAQGKIVLMIK